MSQNMDASYVSSRLVCMSAVMRKTVLGSLGYSGFPGRLTQGFLWGVLSLVVIVLFVKLGVLELDSFSEAYVLGTGQTVYQVTPMESEFSLPPNQSGTVISHHDPNDSTPLSGTSDTSQPPSKTWSKGLWVGFGFLAQSMFFGRFLLQWLASEKKRESVIPVGFWWLSLSGGIMLLIYAIHRRDPVFILGQSTGTFIYLRNLYFIYIQHPKPSSPRVG